MPKLQSRVFTAHPPACPPTPPACSPLPQGDGITMCGVDSATTAAARVPEGYTLRGPLRLQRLDSVLRPALGDIQVRETCLQMDELEKGDV